MQEAARRTYHAAWALLVCAVLMLGFAAPAAAGAKNVSTQFNYPPGTIVIVNNERSLYYLLGKGRAKRYRVAVGTRREVWVGRTFVSNMRKNPPWTPVGGDGRTVRGGIASNPLGKRAIYLDWSLLRIHGTPSRRSIGRAASNGCIRMLNEDVIDLYEKVHVGAPVIAINNKADAARFAEHKVSGKLSAYSRVIKRD
jgi:lipoprotein-anchoring transpeptidase ErfK/SrfK